MGTTKTAIQGGGGRYCYTLLIGGYTKALTTWNSTTAVETALSGTDWSTVIAGLEAPGEIAQSIEPFRPFMDSDGVTFVVHPDPDDTFAKDVWATDKTGGAWAKLTASVDSNDTTFTVDDTGDFPTFGSFYIGTERCTYTGGGGDGMGGGGSTSFTGVARGLNEPFGTEGLTRRFGRPHVINTIAGGQAGFPLITDFPRIWVGRSVACYCHRVVDGVVDVLAQAELVFAGHIAAVTDSESGAQHIACEDMRDYVGRSILLGNQWSSLPTEGAYLPATEFISFSEHAENTTPVPPTWPFVPNTNVKLQVGTGGWISEGVNTAEEIIDGINDFLQDALNTSNTLDGTWSLITTSGRRAKFTAQYTTSGSDVWNVEITIKMTDAIAGMLGFPIEGTPRDDSPGSGHPLIYEASDTGDDVIVGIGASYALGHSLLIVNDGDTVDIVGQTGSFINQGSTVPQPWQAQYTTTTGTWGFVTIRDFLFLFKQDSATQYTVHYDEQMLRALQREHPGARPASDTFFGVGLFDSMFIRQDEPIPRFKQIILSHEPKFDDWLRKSFYSTGTTDYNESTDGLDKYDRQLGLNIPYELLGTSFNTSCTELAERSNDQGITILIDKPTKFVEFLLPELQLRNAHLVQAGASLAFIIPGVTTAVASLHALTDSSKAASPGMVARDFSQTDYEREDSPLTHIKISYDRDIGGSYHQSTEILDAQSHTDHGRGEVLTIEARNSFAFGRISAADSVRELIADLSGSVQAFWSRALPVVNRSLAAANWFITPGDTISLTDNFSRNVGDGTRGITTVPGWALRVTRNWKLDEMRGVIDVVTHGNDASRRALYSPAMKVDETGPGGSDAGYDSGGPYLWVKSNEFSTTAEDDDVTHFDVSDTVTIMEKSPATIGSPTTWTRTIDAIGTGGNANRLTLSSTLSSPAWDNTLEYYVFAQPYASTQSTQKIHAFIGDDADGKVVDSVRTYLWGQQPFDGIVTTAPDATELHEYPVDDGTWEDDGEPCTPVSHRNAIWTAINLTNRRTSPHYPQFLETAASTASTSYVQCCFPWSGYIGNGELTGSLYRRLNIAPIMEQAAASTGTVRVTSSALPPRAAAGAIDFTTVAFVGPKAQVEFTNTSTSLNNVGRQQLVIVPVPGQPYTWITVEFKTSASTLTFHGFHEWWLSELGG